jgi:exodeoxyribonuclease VII small subunit
MSNSFEDKLNNSKEILDKLVNPNITLEESMKLYTDGLQLIKEAQTMIEEAQTKIEVINKSNHNI